MEAEPVHLLKRFVVVTIDGYGSSTSNTFEHSIFFLFHLLAQPTTSFRAQMSERLGAGQGPEKGPIQAAQRPALSWRPCHEVVPNSRYTGSRRHGNQNTPSGAGGKQERETRGTRSVTGWHPTVAAARRAAPSAYGRRLQRTPYPRLRHYNERCDTGVQYSVSTWSGPVRAGGRRRTGILARSGSDRRGTD